MTSWNNTPETSDITTHIRYKNKAGQWTEWFEASTIKLRKNGGFENDTFSCNYAGGESRYSGNHAWGYNGTTIGLAALGNFNSDVLSEDLINGLGKAAGLFAAKFNINIQPNAKVTLQHSARPQTVSTVPTINGASQFPGSGNGGPGTNILNNMEHLREIARK